MNDYPENDNEFEDKVIKAVGPDSMSFENGWSLGIPSELAFIPLLGMTARLYGRGIGFQVRGMFINGTRVYYRTQAEEQEYREIQIYGKDAAEWLARWDAGKTVFSVSMGGFGPGYEQALQICAVEFLRELLKANYEMPLDKEEWQAIDKAIDENEKIKKLGLSGAQWGAARNLAACIYRSGPRFIKTAKEDRHIQVSKNFPQG